MPKRKRSVKATPLPKPPVVKERRFCQASASAVLSDLPEEILRKIFEMLDPQSVIAISKLNVKRLDNLLLDLKVADFSTCNAISSEDLTSYFQKGRAKHLNVLNLNNLYGVTLSTLRTCIEKCKNITKLYVFNCGLEISKIDGILDSCTHLEELYWSIQESFESCLSILTTRQNKNVKKIYLQVNTGVASYFICQKLIAKCPNAKDFVLNFSPSYITCLPAQSASKYLSMRLRLRQDPTFSLNVLTYSKAETLPHDVIDFVKYATECGSNAEGFIEWVGDKDMPYFLTYHSSFLQVFDDDLHLSEIPELPCESVKSLVLIMDKKPDTLNHLEKIKKMTGKALRHLSLYRANDLDRHQPQGMNPGPLIPNRGNLPLEPDIDSHYIGDVLCDLVANSSNISVLDLSELHMLVDFPFSSLCNLRNLKVLNLNTCCFREPVVEPSTVDKNKRELENVEDFATFITKCNEVENFSIYHCKFECQSRCMEDVLSKISKWPKLKYLTVHRVKQLRICKFLRHIADSCHKLTSLELFLVGEPKVCHFLPNIKYVLEKSKELKFLRINQPGLYPIAPDIWKHIHMAQALEGICLSTNLKTAIVNKTIVDAISKLPRLHLFHLISSNFCENLTNVIKRVMTDNGVKQPDVKISCFAEHFTRWPVNFKLMACFCRHLPLE